MDYDTSALLEGECSAELARQSAEAAPTGAVPAYRDSDGVWQYVEPSQVEHYERNLGESVRTVYVEE